MKVNLKKILFLITTFSPAIIYRLKTHLTGSDTLIHCTSYNHINKQADRTLGGSSIIIKINISHSEVNLKTNRQAVAFAENNNYLLAIHNKKDKQ